jgi:hypothetical protein
MIGRETKSIGRSPLVDVFATPTLAALLAEFALSPEESFYQRELVRRTGGSLYLVQRELKRLERAGLIVREERGRQVEYHYDVSSPAAAGLRDAVLKTFALGGRLAADLSGVEGIRAAFVFGSIASGAESPESDLDILVIGDLGLRDAAKHVMPTVRSLGREPNIVVIPESEWRDRVAAGEHFVTTVLSEPKIWLVGDDAQLAELSE